VSLKRKVRNFVSLVKGEQPPFDIYVKEKAIHTQQQEKAYLALGLDPKGKDGKRKGGDDVETAKKWMCQNFYDIRTFGAVMGLKEANCGQVRGPVQLTFSRSVDPVVAQEHSITRMAVATAAEAEKQDGDNRTMGRKFTVPYGLYAAHGFVSSFLAKQTGFDENDLELLWQALAQMFEHDRSAARGEMSTRGLYVFKHDSELGNAPAHNLFELIQVKKNSEDPARDFADYTVAVNESGIPSGVTLQRRIG
jgi:CRISPR-associated protein Csd2